MIIVEQHRVAVHQTRLVERANVFDPLFQQTVDALTRSYAAAGHALNEAHGLAIASIALLLSTVTRNLAAAVVGALMASLFMQVLGALSALDFLDPYLLSTQFNAWQGLLRDPIDWDPIVRAAWVSGLYAVPSLLAALTVFVRRDVTA